MTNLIKNISVFLLIGATLNWNLQGHSIIARIVELELKNVIDQPVLDKIYQKLESLYPFFDNFETKNSLLEAAVLPDVLNFQFGKFLQPVHFKDNPELYKNDDVSLFRAPDKQEETASSLLITAKKVIKESLDPDKKKFIKNGFMDSLLTRYLLHVGGDVHQPLHTISLYSNIMLDGKIKAGDLGGNLIEVQFPGEGRLMKFHALWDDGIGMFETVNEFPYSKEMKLKINKFAVNFMKEFPRSYFGEKANILDHEQWIQESHDLAVKVAYADIDLFPTLRPEYVVRCRKIVKERITLAGYRLASLLKELFN